MHFPTLVLLNDARGHAFAPYTEDAPLTAVLASWTVEADDTESALDAMWRVGNRQEQDATEALWPRTVRSLCVGDVVVVRDPITGGTSWHAVGRWGWDPIVLAPRATAPANPLTNPIMP